MGSRPEDLMKPPDLDLKSGAVAPPEVQKTRFQVAELPTGSINGVNGGLTKSIMGDVTQLPIASCSRGFDQQLKAQTGTLFGCGSALVGEFPSAEVLGVSKTPAKTPGKLAHTAPRPPRKTKVISKRAVARNPFGLGLPFPRSHGNPLRQFRHPCVSRVRPR